MTYKDVLDRGNPGEVGGVLANSDPTGTANDGMGTALAKLMTPITEALTVSSHTCTLAHLPMPGLVVVATAGSSTGPKAVVFGAPSAGQVQVAPTTGVLTFNSTDAISGGTAWYVAKPVDFLAKLAATYPGF